MGKYVCDRCKWCLTKGCNDHEEFAVWYPRDNSAFRLDEPTYDVTLTLRLSTTMSFARGEGLNDYDIIRPSDAIENAISTLNMYIDKIVDDGEFTVAFPIDGEATLRS